MERRFDQRTDDRQRRECWRSCRSRFQRLVDAGDELDRRAFQHAGLGGAREDADIRERVGVGRPEAASSTCRAGCKRAASPRATSWQPCGAAALVGIGELKISSPFLDERRIERPRPFRRLDFLDQAFRAATRPGIIQRRLRRGSSRLGESGRIEFDELRQCERERRRTIDAEDAVDFADVAREAGECRRRCGRIPAIASYPAWARSRGKDNAPAASAMRDILLEDPRRRTVRCRVRRRG